MTQLVCAANQTIHPLLSQDEMKVKVYNPGGISHDAALPPPMPHCRRCFNLNKKHPQHGFCQ
jgi:hypothetical protein